jgi:hypothetical protein
VAPEFATVDGKLLRFQSGGLLLGIKILTTGSFKIFEAGFDFYLTTRVTGFDSPAII